MFIHSRDPVVPSKTQPDSRPKWAKCIPGGGGTLGNSGWGCAAGTLEPLTYTRASSAEFLLPYTRVNSQNPPILE